MRCCRSDWPGLVFSANRVDFRLFLPPKLSILTRSRIFAPGWQLRSQDHQQLSGQIRTKKTTPLSLCGLSTSSLKAFFLCFLFCSISLFSLLVFFVLLSIFFLFDFCCFLCIFFVFVLFCFVLFCFLPLSFFSFSLCHPPTYQIPILFFFFIVVLNPFVLSQ